jgi:hypothetical protein
MGSHWPHRAHVILLPLPAAGVNAFPAGDVLGLTVRLDDGLMPTLKEIR